MRRRHRDDPAGGPARLPDPRADALDLVATGRARFDRFIEDLGRPVTDLAGPTEPEPAPDRVAAVAALHDIEVLGPPPAVLEEGF